MANTTNFGWETPDDTDLVKDGAAAMRTLGNAIDSSLVDLKGGTSGQILAKNSNTDMDFVWITNDVGDITEVVASSPLTGGGTSGAVTIGIQDATTAQKGAVQLTNSVSSTSTTTAATPSSVKSAYDLADAAIAKSFVNAKGDLISASANDTPAILTAGANGETLLADSSQTAGLRYNPPVGSLANPVINGGFDIWQRGTSNAGSSTAYSADRWQSYRTVAGSTFSRQITNDTTNLPNIQYAMRVQRDSGNSSTNTIELGQTFESTNSIPLAGKTITLSFYARAGANYSAASSNLQVILKTGTGTDQNTFTGFTGSTLLINQNVTLTTTWQRFAISATIGSTMTQVAPMFIFTPVGTAGANDWYEVTGVQIDVGTWTASTAPTFRRSGATLAGELAACQRYYVRFTGNDKVVASGTYYTTTDAYHTLHLPVEMRTTPTGAASSTGALAIFSQAAGKIQSTNVTLTQLQPKAARLLGTTTVATGGQGTFAQLWDANAWIEVTAEL